MKNTNRMNLQLECDRQEDLVAFLYDEATTLERASFEQHLNDCDPCQAELKAFGRVRDELSTWQVGIAPRTRLVLPRGRMEVLREFIALFPVWARGLAVAGAAAAAVLLSLSIFWARGGVNQNNFAISSGGASAVSQKEIESLVKNAVAAEREKMQREYQAQFADFKAQLDAGHKAELQAISAEHQAKLEAAKASLRQEIKKSNPQRGSIRSFFAMGDDRQDSWSDVKE